MITVSTATSMDMGIAIKGKGKCENGGLENTILRKLVNSKGPGVKISMVGKFRGRAGLCNGKEKKRRA